MKERSEAPGSDPAIRYNGGVVDISEHLVVMRELAECKEKYYRLGAELRQLKKIQATSPAISELAETKESLNLLRSRQEALKQELNYVRLDAAARERSQEERIESLQASLEKAGAQVDAYEETQQRQQQRIVEKQKVLVENLRSNLDDMKHAMGALTEENEKLHRQLAHMKRLRDDTARHNDDLHTIIRELRDELIAAKHDTSLSNTMAQLLLDNQRLVHLLIDTKEFAQFIMYTTLEDVSYSSPESFPEFPCNDSPRKDLMAWGRLVSEMEKTYPLKNTKTFDNRIDFNVEEKHWVPSKVLQHVHIFRQSYCKTIPSNVFYSFIEKLNSTWQESCLVKVKAVHEQHHKIENELRCQLKHGIPYDAIVQTREIARLRQEIIVLTRKKLKGKPKSSRKSWKEL